MKKLLMALAMIGVFTATSAAADATTLKARIPFDFSAAGTEFSAGVYSVERQPLTGVMAIRDAAGHTKAFLQVNPIYINNYGQAPMLVFNKYGDRYFLAKVLPPVGMGSQLRKDKMEKELMAAAPADQVLVAAIYR
jgi:hypothetical protein